VATTTLAATTLAASAAIATPSLGASAAGIALGGRLGALLGHELIELAVVQHLGHGANREAQGCHGGTQLESFLNGSGGTHFVVA
jgi:hypothetical protein